MIPMRKQLDLFYDDRGFPIVVGTRVNIAGSNEWGTVIGFDDWDIDDSDAPYTSWLWAGSACPAWRSV